MEGRHGGLPLRAPSLPVMGRGNPPWLPSVCHPIICDCSGPFPPPLAQRLYSVLS